MLPAVKGGLHEASQPQLTLLRNQCVQTVGSSATQTHYNLTRQ
jgi:hypothetical protein